jgi:hypothetical protein
LFSTSTLITSDLVAQKGKRLPLQEEIFEANLEYAGNSLEKETISRDNNLSWPPETTKRYPRINLN